MNNTKQKVNIFHPPKSNRSGKPSLPERFFNSFSIHSHFVTFSALSTLRVTAIGACTLSAVL